LPTANALQTWRVPLPKENKMGKNLDIYREYYDAAWTNPPSSLFEANERYLADDFQSLDKDGNVEMNKEAYLGMVRLLFSSFSDFKAVISDMHEEGDSVIVSSRFEGTHAGDLDLSAMGMGVIPASGKRIVWPEASTTWKFKGDQILSIQANDDAGGAGAFLAALGVTPPSA
jgi:predicted ester cyclase